VFTTEQTTRQTCGGFKLGKLRRAHFEAPAKADRSGFCRDVDHSNLDPARLMDSAPFNGLPDDVLIVEDDPIIALDFEDTILGFGVKTVRTAASVAKALGMIADRPPGFALLDVGLISEKTFAVAERLDALDIPYVFVTGYGSDVWLPPALAGKPRLPKPCPSEALEAALRRRPGASTQ
jgi:CheY-like chemotaxis protein